MKSIVFLLFFLLSGCYLANSNPKESNYWIKEGNRITFADKKKCKDEVYSTFDKRFFYLLNKSDDDYISLRKNIEEYREFKGYLEKESSLISQCYYSLGYRFRAPYYWCVAENNMETCKINQKYR